MDKKTRDRLTKLAEAGGPLDGLEVCVKATMLHMALDFAAVTAHKMSPKPIKLTLNMPEETVHALERIRKDLDPVLTEAVIESAIMSALNEGLKEITKTLIQNNDPVALSILGDDVATRFAAMDRASTSYKN